MIVKFIFIDLVFSSVIAKYAFGSFSRIRGCPNFRLMAACVFKHSTDTNGTVSSSIGNEVVSSAYQAVCEL